MITYCVFMLGSLKAFNMLNRLHLILVLPPKNQSEESEP